jgi:hypothetical protein
LVSYAIVVVKSLGQPALNQAWLQRALKDENVQYALLALYWAVSKPVYSESYGASGARRFPRAKRDSVRAKRASVSRRAQRGSATGKDERSEKTRGRRRTAENTRAKRDGAAGKKIRRRADENQCLVERSENRQGIPRPSSDGRAIAKRSEDRRCRCKDPSLSEKRG